QIYMSISQFVLLTSSFCTSTSPPVTSSLSLHDALPISGPGDDCADHRDGPRALGVHVLLGVDHRRSQTPIYTAHVLTQNRPEQGGRRRDLETADDRGQRCWHPHLDKLQPCTAAVGCHEVEGALVS